MKPITFINTDIQKNENSEEQNQAEQHRSFQIPTSKANSLRPRKSLVRMKSVKPLNVAPRFLTEKED